MTEEKEVYSSIFDAASRLERKKAVEKAMSEATALARPKEKQPLLSDEEIAEKFENYKKLHNLIADRLDEVFVRHNLTPRKLRDYFSSARNFTHEQWRLIEKQKTIVEEMLAKLVTHPDEGEVVKPSGEKTKEKRPQKMQVKSRWISMH